MLIARNKQMRARNLAFGGQVLVADEALRFVQLEDVDGLRRVALRDVLVARRPRKDRERQRSRQRDFPLVLRERIRTKPARLRVRGQGTFVASENTNRPAISLQQNHFVKG
jgi:hypothetical protein